MSTSGPVVLLREGKEGKEEEEEKEEGTRGSEKLELDYNLNGVAFRSASLNDKSRSQLPLWILSHSKYFIMLTAFLYICFLFSFLSLGFSSPGLAEQAPGDSFQE